MGVPYVPARNVLSTDTFEYSGGKMAECPFTGKSLMLQPALYPDVSVIHVHEGDVYGNLNSTIIGDDHSKPKVRFPGSGGANDFASFCWRMMVTTVQDVRRFVEKVDFVTTPGWLQGGDSRVRSGLPLGAGPHKIITDMGLMDFEPETKRMRVISINPGCSFKDLQDNCGFELLQAAKVAETEPPTEEELTILREEVDPYRYTVGR
jgi:glutaconate CoA-transferase subunit B